MKKIVTLFAACAAIVLASCTQPSTSGSDVGGGRTEADNKIELGLDSMDGWGKYEISDKSATGFTMKSTAAQQENDCGGANIAFGAAEKVTFKVTNNASEECWIQVIIKKDGETGSGTRISSASIDGVAVEGDITWGVNTTIATGVSKEFVLNLIGNDADKFVFALNSNSESLSKTSGNITLSNAYMYK